MITLRTYSLFFKLFPTKLINPLTLPKFSSGLAKVWRLFPRGGKIKKRVQIYAFFKFSADAPEWVSAQVNRITGFWVHLCEWGWAGRWLYAAGGALRLCGAVTGEPFFGILGTPLQEGKMRSASVCSVAVLLLPGPVEGEPDCGVFGSPLRVRLGRTVAVCS